MVDVQNIVASVQSCESREDNDTEGARECLQLRIYLSKQWRCVIFKNTSEEVRDPARRAWGASAGDDPASSTSETPFARGLPCAAVCSGGSRVPLPLGCAQALRLGGGGGCCVMDGHGDKCFNYFFSVCALRLSLLFPFISCCWDYGLIATAGGGGKFVFFASLGDLFCNRTVPF